MDRSYDLIIHFDFSPKIYSVPTEQCVWGKVILILKHSYSNRKAEMGGDCSCWRLIIVILISFLKRHFHSNSQFSVRLSGSRYEIQTWKFSAFNGAEERQPLKAISTPPRPRPRAVRQHSTPLRPRPRAVRQHSCELSDNPCN